MSDIVTTDHRVMSSQAGLRLFLRNKRRAGLGPASVANTVLFVHGATYPSSVTFDYAIDGQSWMDQMAAAGFDVWALDTLGYGGSDRPPALDQEAAANPPQVDTAWAVADLHLVVEHILAAGGLDRLNLIGYSWGTSICGSYAGEAPAKVARLVLYGCAWLRESSAIAGSGPPVAYRMVSGDAIRARWLFNLDPEQQAAVVDDGDIEAWASAAIASDPDASKHQPPLLRAPSGVVKDSLKYWLNGRPAYDPGRIEAATLIVTGEWDQETPPEGGRAVFDRLTGAVERRLTVIGRGTHSLLLENQRHALHATVAAFLAEGRGQ